MALVLNNVFTKVYTNSTKVLERIKVLIIEIANSFLAGNVRYLVIIFELIKYQSVLWMFYFIMVYVLAVVSVEFCYVIFVEFHMEYFTMMTVHLMFAVASWIIIRQREYFFKSIDVVIDLTEPKRHQTASKIRHEMVTVVRILAFEVIVMTPIFMTFLPLGKEQNYLLIIQMYHRYVPKPFPPLFYVLHYVSLTILSLLESSLEALVIFMASVVSQRFLRAEDETQTMRRSNDENLHPGFDLELVEDETLQNKVSEELRRCIEVQVTNISFIKDVNTALNMCSQVLLIFWCFIILPLNYCYLMKHGVEDMMSFRIFGFAIMITVTFSICCDYVQNMINSADDFYNNLFQCKWYEWNLTNRRNYVLLLQMIQRSPALNFYHVFRVSRIFLLNCGKVIHKVLLFWRNVVYR